MIKIIFYILLAAALGLIIWLYPKYSFIKQNPSFCTKLVDHIYYCGTVADMEKFFK